jgi:glycosyltransferase involved in cell wall biosynthesis
MVWLGYRDHYVMSGVLVQAGSMGLPVVACNTGLIGWLTHKYELGLTVPIDNVDAVTKTIAQLSPPSRVSTAYGENGRRFSAHHTPEEFARIVTRFE